jgi:hypothetical protein
LFDMFEKTNTTAKSAYNPLLVQKSRGLMKKKHG